MTLLHEIAAVALGTVIAAGTTTSAVYAAKTHRLTVRNSRYIIGDDEAPESRPGILTRLSRLESAARSHGMELTDGYDVEETEVRGSD